LSQKAYAVKEEINQIYQQWFKKFLDEIEENEAEKVINTLEKMYKIIQKRN